MKIPLFENTSHKSYMQLHLLDQVKRPIVLIAPGGGYVYTSKREDDAVVNALHQAGYHAAVLYYRETLSLHPQPLKDAQQAIALLRKNAQAWHVDDSMIIGMGFSAGGHVIASAALHERLVDNPCHLNLMVLCYPVITGYQYAHEGSLKTLFGHTLQTSSKHTFSQELHVTPNTPNTFIWHTVDDAAVPVENALLFIDALQKNHVPFEAHLFQTGRHGLSLATKETPFDDDDPEVFHETHKDVAIWFDLMVNFIERNQKSAEK